MTSSLLLASSAPFIPKKIREQQKQETTQQLFFLVFRNKFLRDRIRRFWLRGLKRLYISLRYFNKNYKTLYNLDLREIDIFIEFISRDGNFYELKNFCRHPHNLLVRQIYIHTSTAEIFKSFKFPNHLTSLSITIEDAQVRERVDVSFHVPLQCENLFLNCRNKYGIRFHGTFPQGLKRLSLWNIVFPGPKTSFPLSLRYLFISGVYNYNYKHLTKLNPLLEIHPDIQSRSKMPIIKKFQDFILEVENLSPSKHGAMRPIIPEPPLVLYTLNFLDNNVPTNIIGKPPNTIQYLSLGQNRCKIPVGWIPLSVTKLEIYCETLIDEIGIIPTSVTELTILSSMENIAPGSLPDSITKLELKLDVLIIPPNILPNRLKTLSISFNIATPPDYPFEMYLPISITNLAIKNKTWTSRRDSFLPLHPYINIPPFVKRLVLSRILIECFTLPPDLYYLKTDYFPRLEWTPPNLRVLSFFGQKDLILEIPPTVFLLETINSFVAISRDITFKRNNILDHYDHTQRDAIIQKIQNPPDKKKRK